MTVILNRVRTENATTEISTKNGSDVILLMSCDLTGNVKINSGGGSDVLLVSEFAYMRQCDINMGSGNDHLLVENGFVGFQAKLNLGSGNDKVAFYKGEFGTPAINGGGGFDELAVRNSNFATLSVRSLEDQTSNNFADIYNTAFYTNATFAAAWYNWANFLYGN